MISAFTAASASTYGDLAPFIDDGSSFAFAAFVAVAAWKAYKYLRANEREDRNITDHRLDNLRTNVSRLTVYAGQLSRMIPPDVDQPPFPDLLPELPHDHR